MPTKDSADKRSSRMDEEDTRKVAVFSCVAAWQLGPRPLPQSCRQLLPNRLLQLAPARQSSICLGPSSSGW
jgi:hypothetical protein